MSKRAAIYARVSTDMQRDNYSIPSQIADSLRYAEKSNYSIVGNRYVDRETGQDVITLTENSIPAFVDDYSSRELTRPALDGAISYLEEYGFDVLIIHALDRLARDPYIRQTLENEITSRGARVEFVLGNYEDTAEGEVRKDLDATFGKWENAKRVERCNRGKRRKAEGGKFPGGFCPYGYEIDSEAPSGLRIIPEEAEIVQRIFTYYVVDQVSIRAIVQMLDAEGAVPEKGGSWATSTIHRILERTEYAGWGYYNRTKRVGKSKRVERPKEEWIRFEPPAIVDMWMYKEAQKKLADNRLRTRQQASRFYLLSGMVFCEACGKAYFPQAQRAGKQRRANDAPFYRHRQKEGHCINRMISARKLDPVVWDGIAGILLNPEKLKQGYEDSLAQQEETRTRERAHLEELKKGFLKLEQRRKNLTAAYIDPDIPLTKSEYLEQKDRIDREVKEVTEQVGIIEQELAAIPTPAHLETLEEFISNVRKCFDGDIQPEPELQREILQTLHVRVWLTPDEGIRLEGWFGSDVTLSTPSARYEQHYIKFSLDLLEQLYPKVELSV